MLLSGRYGESFSDIFVHKSHDKICRHFRDALVSQHRIHSLNVLLEFFSVLIVKWGLASEQLEHE